MTKVAMIFEKEKEEAVKKAVKEENRKVKIQFALKMIADGELSLEKIAEYAGLDIKTVEELSVKG